MLRSAATPNRTEVQPRPQMTQITPRRLPTATPNADLFGCAHAAVQTVDQTNHGHSLV